MTETLMASKGVMTEKAPREVDRGGYRGRGEEVEGGVWRGCSEVSGNSGEGDRGGLCVFEGEAAED
jgi:hypothetical protein